MARRAAHPSTMVSPSPNHLAAGHNIAYFIYSAYQKGSRWAAFFLYPPNTHSISINSYLLRLIIFAYFQLFIESQLLSLVCRNSFISKIQYILLIYAYLFFLSMYFEF
jgi:hypothetical protein